ncbi:hypothetical protein [Chryseobacterium sp. SIMBA_038]|uniref:hypothetical protein n=1 Tax=Chryseobacterium sp. SIMBA_038 TaxID=3085780 RepID=UPI00397C5390
MQNLKIITSILGLWSAMVFSQNYKTSVTALEGKEFPKINAENQAQFKVYFPDAKSVVLEGGDGMQNLKSVTTKDKDGF